MIVKGEFSKMSLQELAEGSCGKIRTKVAFHARAMRALRKLAKALDLPKGSYEVRSNMAGPGVSGEIVLHADNFYVEVSKGAPLSGLMYRTCNGRDDYTGGQNHYASLDYLENAPSLVVDSIRKICS